MTIFFPISIDVIIYVHVFEFLLWSFCKDFSFKVAMWFSLVACTSLCEMIIFVVVLCIPFNCTHKDRERLKKDREEVGERHMKIGLGVGGGS